jgi:hypothetical protein
MNTWKLRLLLMGPILTFLGSALMASKGFLTSYLVLPIIGVVLLAAGLVWKPSPPKPAPVEG